MEILLTLAVFASAAALLIGLVLLPFRRRRRVGTWMSGMSFVVCPIAMVLLGLHIEQQHRDEATQAGFRAYEDLKLAREVGITDPKAFYADAYAIRGRAVLKQRAEETARKLAAKAEQEIAEAKEEVRRTQEARRASDAVTELATAAPVDQQPPANPEFGSGYYRYKHNLRTAAGYPFVRMREDVPLCTHPYAVKDATDAVRAKDRAWLATITACKLFPKGTAVEWSQESVGGLPVLGIRIKAPDGGRLTVYAPDFSEAGTLFWVGFYDLDEMRSKAATAVSR